MKTKIRDIVSIVIFIVLIISAVMLVRPVYFKLTSRVSSYARELKENVEKSLSLKISYKSLSPSILSSVSLKDVSLKTFDGREVAGIDKIRLDYKLLPILKGDFVNGVKALLIDGMEVESHEIINLLVPEGKNISENKSDLSEKTDGMPDLKEIAEKLEGFKAELPVSVIFRNLAITYQNDELSARALVRKMTVDYTAKSSQLSFDSDIQVTCSYKKQDYSGNLNIDGKLYNGFENSSANISLSSLTDGNLRLNKINFLVNYAGRNLSLTTIKNTFPLVLTASCSLDTEQAALQIKSNDLTLKSIVQTRKQNDILRKYAGFSLSTDSSVTYDRKKNDLKYKSNTSAYIPDSFIPSGGNAHVVVKGNLNEVSVSELEFINKDYDVTGNLELPFKNYSLSGFIDARKVMLPGGTNINGEIYFDPLENGFMAFIPQIFIDDTSFTAIQLTAVPDEESVDFSFEGYDYSHFEADEPGKISGDGSFLLKEKYIQTSLSVNSFFLDSVIKTAASFVPPENKETIENFAAQTENYLFSGDSYFSTDFKNLSFNVPYILAVDTSKENQALYLSLDGNNQSISLSKADLVLGKYAFHASGSIDMFPETDETFILMNLRAGEIPYKFSGTLANNTLWVSGDYKSEISLDFTEIDNLTGKLSWDNFPVSLQGVSVLSSLNSDFSFSGEKGLSVNINKFDLEEAGNLFDFKPRLSATGNVTEKGINLSQITYSDLYSRLSGNANVALSLENSLLESVGLSLNLQNPLSDEAVVLSAKMANKDLLPVTPENIKKNCFFDINGQIKRFGMNRFTKNKSNNNELSCSVIASGTLENPEVSLNLENLSLMTNGDAVKLNGSAMVEDKILTIHDFSMNMRDLSVNQVYGNVSLNDFSGKLNANIDGLFIAESFHVPLNIESKNAVIKPGSYLPSELTVMAYSDDVYGSLFKKKLDFHLNANISESGISLESSENLGLMAYLSSEGTLIADLLCKGIAKTHIGGAFKKENGKMQIDFSDVDVDMKALFDVLNFDQFVIVHSGLLKGNVGLYGTFDNPNMAGNLTVFNPLVLIPLVMKEKLQTEKVFLNFSTGEIDIPETVFTVKKNSEMTASARIIFDKWKYDHLEAKLKTYKGRYIPVYIADASKKMIISGDGGMNLDLSLTVDEFNLTGNVFAERAELFINLTKMLASLSQPSETVIPMNISLDVSMGTHVRVSVDPLLRAIFVPGQKLRVELDGYTNALTLIGNLGLKSGDVSYLNRNFYIKEGSLKFSASDEGFNPLVNIVAETRERDEKGDSVTISLNGINQYLTSFNPSFSSVPAKSEVEIQKLLGQIVVADSESVGNFLFAAGDYALQSLVGRKFENTLRDFLNFDIFSLRTNIIQNTLNLGLTQNRKPETLNAGNFFDNSTVYIGKYLGSALYVDAMVNLQYDEHRLTDALNVGGMVFQPEFGMELESPFGNIRWNIAPDIDAMMRKQYIPSSSLSLSWKFAF